jgi:HAD superfamily hydrolase (TIGR01549 family)
MPLSRRHWIFDMDGTLTLAAHDFQAFKQSHGLDPNRPILEQIPDLPLHRQDEVRRELVEWEGGIADRAQRAPGALPLLQHLQARNYQLAILTRNTRDLALRTLNAAGLREFFPDPLVLGRGCAEPKPSPAGVLRILGQWEASPTDAVMVGDYLFDLEAGRSAGVFTIYIDRDRSRMWQDQADLSLTRLDQLLGRNQ